MEQQRNIAATKLAIKHYWHQVQLDWRSFLPGALLPTISAILVNYVPTLIIASLLVKFSEKSYSSIADFIPYILLFTFVWATGEVFTRIGYYYSVKYQVKGLERLYNNAMNYLFTKDTAFFHNNFTGSLTKRVTDYCWKYLDLNNTLLNNVFANYIPVIFAGVILWFFSPWLVVGLLGLMFLTGFLVFPLIKKRQKLVAIRETASNRTTGYVADILGNMDAVKAFSHEAFEAKNHAANVKDLAMKGKRSWDFQNLRVDMITSPFYVLTNTVGLLLALILGSSGHANLAVVFVTFNYYAQATRLMWEFNQVYRNLENSITQAAQFTELLLEEPQVTDIAQPHSFSVKNGQIELRNIAFRYDDGSDEHLFENLNLAIKPGEKVALVGHSGGGKTTITRLLMRYMDIDEGEILIDDQNIAKVRQHDLRRSIAYVPQEPVMFHRSLMDNIRYGKLDASDDEVTRIAKLAHAHEFIKDLPKGYDTLVGERGIKLSGGQRQRIAIARAMIKDAPILLLDEATSALDSESEKYIQDALWKLMEGRTAIVIAHRLSTIQKMDRIIVLEDGQVTQAGTHKELLTSGGIYANLWAHQSGGFIEE